jgi:hypothetical protein
MRLQQEEQLKQLQLLERRKRVDRHLDAREKERKEERERKFQLLYQQDIQRRQEEQVFLKARVPALFHLFISQGESKPTNAAARALSEASEEWREQESQREKEREQARAG